MPSPAPERALAVLGKHPLTAGASSHTRRALVQLTLVWALECEIEGDARNAVLALVGALHHLKRIEFGEAEEVEAELGDKPSAGELCTVLRRWIERGAAWGGPTLGWMRDLCHRLEDGRTP
jgi:hypothetical protein